MEDVYLPLSGAVTQTFFPWINNLTINVGRSSDANVEKQLLTVASYGKQLGRIGDALLVLVKYLPPAESLSPADQDAITALKEMLGTLAKEKAKHSKKPATATT